MPPNDEKTSTGISGATKEYVINTAAHQLKAKKQFANQTGVDKGTCMLSIGLVRKPLLIARLVAHRGKTMRRALNERQYAVECAIRVYTHFNPQHGYCARRMLALQMQDHRYLKHIHSDAGATTMEPKIRQPSQNSHDGRFLLRRLRHPR